MTEEDRAEQEELNEVRMDRAKKAEQAQAVLQNPVITLFFDLEESEIRASFESFGIGTTQEEIQAAVYYQAAIKKLKSELEAHLIRHQGDLQRFLEEQGAGADPVAGHLNI